ncbi:ribosome silencing factor [bacterium]|nr:ribosome silencing factor [bacterium]
MVKAREAQLSNRPPLDDDLTMEDVLRIAVTAIEDKKGEDAVVLDISDQLDYIDYIIVCTGQTDLHTKAIADNIKLELSRYDIIPDGLNGYRHGDWILLDYGVLVVHVFLPALRDFYRLEELWAGGRAVELKS